MQKAVSYKPGIHVGLGPSSLRKIEPQGKRMLPPGTTVVSADSHWSLSEDIFHDAFPERLRDRAPRIVHTGGIFDWQVNGKSMIPRAVREHFRDFEQVPGCSDLEQRLLNMDAEGIAKEINFGNGLGAFYHYPDLEVREWIFRIHNRYLARMQAKAPGRFYGVGLINFWDMDKVRESLAEVKELGLKTILIPINPHGADMQPLNYCLPEMAPMWEAIAAADLPVCFHVGEFFKDGPGGVAMTAIVGFGPFRRSLSEVIFGGILDRHPNLKIVFVEADINWVPGALQTAEMVYESYGHLIDPKIEHHPAHYWHKNCYATVMSDPVGWRMIDLIGADRIMWASDYPHPESIYGRCWSAMEEVLDAVSENDARKILGGTAMEVFRLD